MKVWGALGRHLEAKLEPKMAPMCALAAQLGSTSPIESPSKVTSPIESRSSVEKGSHPRIPRRIGVHKRGYDIYIYIYIII